MHRKLMIWSGAVVLSVALLAGLRVPISAQTGPYTVKVVQVDSSRFPEIGVWVSVLDGQGNPVTSLPGSAFTLFENGKSVSIRDVSHSGDQQAATLSVILAIDRSGSMKSSGKMDAAKAAATTFVDQMRQADSTAVVTFDSQVHTVQSLTSDKDALRQAIASIQPAGNTALYDALNSSVDMLVNATGRKVIILLSDGLDNSSKNTAKGLIARVNGTELSVYAIGLGDPALGTRSAAGIDEASLRAIADGSHGSYAYAPDPNSLSALYQQFSHQLQNEYLLTYTSTDTLHDGVGRSISVEVTGVGSTQAAYNPGGIIPETPDALTWPVFGILLLGLVGLLFLPGLILNRSGPLNRLLGMRHKSRVKLTSGASASQPIQKQPAAKPRVRIQNKHG